MVAKKRILCVIARNHGTPSPSLDGTRLARKVADWRVQPAFAVLAVCINGDGVHGIGYTAAYTTNADEPGDGSAY